MFSRFGSRIIYGSKKTMPIRKMSDVKDVKDVKYDMMISHLGNIKENLFVMMIFIVPLTSYHIGSEIGTLLGKLIK